MFSLKAQRFKIIQKDGKARAGKIETTHGIIETPSFIPVGTKATVKALTPRDLKEIGVLVVLANTYHLSLQPGADLIKKMGGLHKFMNWDRPLMTDSGGFQVFSLGVALEHGSSKVLKPDENDLEVKSKPRLNQITEEGVTFQSHLDGSKHILTPESSIEIQHKLGADFIVSFDDHESSRHTHDQMLKSIELTERWGLRSLKEFKKLNSKQLMYGVVHGGTHRDLRVRSARFSDQHFDAIALGGIYGDKKTLCQIIEWSLGAVSEGKQRHLLGIGEVEDLFNGVERGIDFFDCVAPTRRARNGSLYICPKCGGNAKNNFTISIGLSKFIAEKNPIDLHCSCYTCQNFSKAYLRHLFIGKEILFHTLTTYHNVFFVMHLMQEIRNAIRNGLFQKLKREYMGT